MKKTKKKGRTKIVLRPKPRRKNPSQKVPSVLVLLGRALELGTDDGYCFALRSYNLYSNAAGDKLYLLESKKKKKAVLGNSELVKKAKRTYSRFTEFVADHTHNMEVTEAALKKLCAATYIVYESDKWSGKKVDYIHHWEHRTTVWADKLNEPTAFCLTGKIAVRPEGITG